MATLPDGAEPHTAGDADELQFVLVATERVVPLKESPLPTISDLMKFEPLPTRMPPSGVVLAVPPYRTPIEVVAEILPLLAWSGPLSEARTTPPLNVLRAEKRLVE